MSKYNKEERQLKREIIAKIRGNNYTGKNYDITAHILKYWKIKPRVVVMQKPYNDN